MTRILTFLLGCLLMVSAPAALTAAEPESSPFVLVLDPGHGGNDLGTSGRNLHEKNVTLDVCRRLGQLVTGAFGDSVQVVFTRTTDEFIPLRERAAIANRADADLFISVHVNSVAARSRGRNSVNGTSVYTLGLHKSEANLDVAMAENSVIALEEDFSEAYQGFDPNESESYIVFELTQNLHLENSVEMATLAQRELVSHAGRADRGVRQAGFLVLWATRMPSVLVELDFMCNPNIERYLSQAENRQTLAEALFRAFSAYRAEHPPMPKIHHAA